MVQTEIVKGDVQTDKITVALASTFLVLGVALGFLISPIVTSVQPRDDHRWTAENTIVYDTVFKVYYTFECTKVTNVKKGMSLLSLKEGHTYPRSEWAGRRLGTDVEVYMSIWGPSEENELVIEIARLAGNELQITAPDGRSWTMPQISEKGVQLGYLSFTIQFSS